MSIKIRMAAWCAAAGRPYNEDNFLLKEDLSNPDWGVMHTDQICSLDAKGALIVVCDGMGGMNAGNVAADLAIQSIQEQFDASLLTPQITSTPENIVNFIEQAIIAADEKIKEQSRQNKELAGMGSTIVLAWLTGHDVYIGWCGDSRAYCYNPTLGLEQLSRDHSYVQELVDDGKLKPELAFDHPDTNIITRSLGDTGKQAVPEVRYFPLYDGDIILLCSDGLSGVLRDQEIEAIIADNTDSMVTCRNALWVASEAAGWTDNVTIALCQIVSGG
ncbi:MAG: protein phosphatase 2C domain-containing protein, partial [Tannerella sp.]|nr:protein phosphatase 2C domain-containing protein [Tannerella sp.]